MKKFQIDHSHKCVMNLESDGESHNSSLDELCCSHSEEEKINKYIQEHNLIKEMHKTEGTYA